MIKLNVELQNQIFFCRKQNKYVQPCPIKITFLNDKTAIPIFKRDVIASKLFFISVNVLIVISRVNVDDKSPMR